MKCLKELKITLKYMRNKILLAAAELTPLAKIGGLADIIGSLPKALIKLNQDVRIVIPKYGVIDEKKYSLKRIKKGIKVRFKNKEELIDIYKTSLPNSNVPLYLISHPKYLGKNGIYFEQDASSGGSKAECQRFSFFAQSILKIFEPLNWYPDVLHCHDWHVGILPVLIKIAGKKSLKYRKIKTVLTIHNLAYQGIYEKKETFQNLELKESDYPTLKLTNKDGDINSLEQGILTADILNTVSPNYAKEILTKEYGAGLESVLLKRKEDLCGILNGIDKIDYSLDKKQADKRKLQKICKLAQNPGIPVISLIGRLTEQKGFDILNPILNKLGEMDLQLIVLASGDPKYEKELIKATKKFPDKLSINIKFDAKLAQQIYAGADMFLMPSEFEPCGLGQMIAMSYGTVPIVRATGGLKDTVKNLKTGFVFKNYNSQELLNTIKRALKIFQNKKAWKQLQTNGIKQDFSWKKSAKKYLEIYQILKSEENKF